MVCGAVLVGVVDYTLIVTTTLTGLFALANTALAYVLVRHVKPKSGGRLADYVEDASQTSRANNLLLRKLNGHGLESAGDTDEDAA